MWYECALAVTNIPFMRPECESANVHSCPGIFGYWPLVDRRINFWIQIVVLGKQSIGIIKAQFLHLLLKPFVDAAMERRILSPEEFPDVNSLMEKYRTKSKDKALIDALHHMGGSP